MEIKINDTTDTGMSPLYVDVHFEIDSEFRLRKKLYEKKHLNFPIVNFPFICSNISTARGY